MPDARAARVRRLRFFLGSWYARAAGITSTACTHTYIYICIIYNIYGIPGMQHSTCCLLYCRKPRFYFSKQRPCVVLDAT